MLLRIFTLFMKERAQRGENRADEIHTKKRLMLHKGIPDLRTIKEVTGHNFTKLQDIFNSFDPVGGDKLSANPKKYELLTRTVIYKLPLMKTKESVADLVYVEFSLWFKHAYSNYKNKEALAEAIYAFKTAAFSSDPFNRSDG